MKNIKLKTKVIIVSIVLLSVSFVGFKIYDDFDDFNIAKNLEIYHSVIKDIRLYYVDEVDLSSLIKESIDELLIKLDPYTVYYPESEIEEYTFITTGAYGGIGATISDNGESLIVVNVSRDTPAHLADLRIADEIVAIDNKRINSINIKELKELIKGEPGSEILFTVKRFNVPNELQIKIVRKNIVVDNIEYSGISSDSIGYIKIRAFKQNTASEFEARLKKMQDSLTLKGLVIDLRGNPGGLLNEAVLLVNLFVPKNSVIVSTKGKVNSWNTVFKAQNNPLAIDLPVAVLVSSTSASASEIVAGAFQDLDRGVVIGQKTYGKGLVQTTRNLLYNTKIKITTAKYYIPSGRCIQTIDYSHRNEDGSVGNIPDSLISKFKTANGRIVFDGGGIIPDITISPATNTPIVKSLLWNRIIFDFCTKYFYENQSVSKPEVFLSDNTIFAKFKQYAIAREFEYVSKTTKELDKLIKTAEKENFSQNQINDLIGLRKTFDLNKNDDIEKNKTEISQFINQELILRYYLADSLSAYIHRNDKEIKKARAVISDKEKYKKILNIK